MTWRRSCRLVLAFFALAALISFTASASGAEEELYSFQKSFGPDGTETSNFARTGGLAIDQGSALAYVIDSEEGKLYKFDLNGQPVNFEGSAAAISGNAITGLSFPSSAGGENQVAIDSASHTIYLTSGNAVEAVDQEGEPVEFTAGPGAGTNEIGGFERLRGVAVDSQGYVYASDLGPIVEGQFTNGSISVYAPSGEFIKKVALSFPSMNIAVAPNGTLYVKEYEGGVNVLDPSAPLPVTGSTTYAERTSPLSTDLTVSVFVDPASGRIFLAQSEPGDFRYGRVAVYAADGSFLGAIGAHGQSSEVGKEVAGVGVYDATGRVFVSSGSHGVAGTEPFSRVEIYEEKQPVEGPPTIVSESVSGVSADAATLRAEINPNTKDTVYHFEFGLSDCGSSACISVPIAPKDIGAGHEPVGVSQAIAGLQPGTTYHYRVIATNDLETTVGEGRTFVTQPASTGFRPADSRVWEMVSPAEKHGAGVRNIKTGIIQAAADGNGMAYESVGSFELFPEGNRALELSTVLSKRREDGVWASKDLTPPHTEVTSSRSDTEYKLFSPNLAEAILEPRDQTLLSVEASERTPYLRQNEENGGPPTYTPLVTGKAPFANVPEGVQFGEAPGGPYPLRVVGSSRDLRHIVLTSKAILVQEEAAPGALYLWENHLLKPVSRTPGEDGSIVRGVLGSGRGSLHNAISSDGSRVFWATESSSDGYSEAGGVTLTGLYGFDRESGETFRLDLPEEGFSSGGPSLPVFQAAAADGGTVFFTDTQQLTADASTGGRDLYRCVIGVINEGKLGCATLTDMSAPRANPGEDAGVMNIAPAASEDGTRIYFFAKGDLSTEPSSLGILPVSGQPNLYLWEAGSGIKFIATLSPRDYLDWGAFEKGGENGEGADVVAAGSPSGQYFTFMSQDSLTGKDNLDVNSRQPVEEAFLFDADTDELSCISCNPTSAAGEGQLQPPALEGENPPRVDFDGLWKERWVAATLAVPSEAELFSLTFYRPRSVLDNGRVFFNAFGGLVPADSNRTWDVYQFEPVGVGSCTASSGDSTVARVGDGCVALISSGTAAGESAFMDASVSGNDAFFLTQGALSAIDHDDALDVYDARVEGIRAEVHPVSECAGENCQAPPLAPNDPTPASEAFSGPGNAVHCGKGRRKVSRGGKSRCVRRKHGKHKKHGRRSGHSGRAHR